MLTFKEYLSEEYVPDRFGSKPEVVLSKYDLEELYGEFFLDGIGGINALKHMKASMKKYGYDFNKAKKIIAVIPSHAMAVYNKLARTGDMVSGYYITSENGRKVVNEILYSSGSKFTVIKNINGGNTREEDLSPSQLKPFEDRVIFIATPEEAIMY